METQGTRKLHPVLWVAAIAVILFSLSGIAAIFGVIPPAGSKTNDTPLEASASAPATAPLVQSGDKTEAAKPAPRAEAPKAAPRHTHARVARAEPSAERPAPPVTYGPKPAEPAVCKDCGVIESVREVAQKGEGTGMGAVAGGVLGGLLGNQVGKGDGRKLATVAGVVGGAVAGHQVERTMRKTVRYEVVVRFDDGTSRAFDYDTAPSWRSGDRVRVQNGMILARG
ncbi:MAG: glycine zipper 2TM domain-containing protein [Pseudomonadota bacterium]